jgi:hypothetical protein
MTKQELEAEVLKLKEQLAVQAHLAAAVDSKDKEIVELKKQEVEYKNLRQKIQEQAHLASAVEAKDKEIIELKKLEVDLKTLKQKVQEQSHLASAVESKDKEIVELKKQIELLKLEAKESNKVLIEKNNQQVLSLSKELETIRPLVKNSEQLKQQNDVLTQIANGYIDNFRSYLKNQQGALEMAIEIEVMLAEKLPKK